MPQNQSPVSQRGRIRAAGDRPSARQLQEILSISCAGLPSSPTPALPAGLAPRYLQQSPARPRSALQNLNPYCGLPPAHPPLPACGALPARVDAAHTVWAAKSLEPGRCRVGSVWPDTRARGRLRRGQACSNGPPAARQCLHARVEPGGGGEERGGLGLVAGGWWRVGCEGGRGGVSSAPGWD